jgi:Ca2+/Na+ antiporter
LLIISSRFVVTSNLLINGELHNHLSGLWLLAWVQVYQNFLVSIMQFWENHLVCLLEILLSNIFDILVPIGIAGSITKISWKIIC